MFDYLATIRVYDFDTRQFITYSLGERTGYTNYDNCKGIFTGFSEVNARRMGELNSGYIEVLSKSEKNFPIFSLITIQIKENGVSLKKTLNYYVGRDEVEKTSKYANDSTSFNYIHKIELIDLTKKLEKKVLETICFTQPTGYYNYLSVAYALKRLFHIYETNKLSTISNTDRDNYYLTLIDDIENKNEGKLFSYIEPTLLAKLENVELPQMVLSNLTLREAFDTIFKVVNAIAIVEYDNRNDEFVLNAEFFNELKDDITNRMILRIYGESGDTNIEEISSELNNFVENQITENFSNASTISFPNKNGYIPFTTRDTNYSITDDNFGILLPYPIYSLKHVYVPVRLEMSWDTGIEHSVIFDVDVDIIDYVVEREQYESLSVNYIRSFSQERSSQSNIIGEIFKNICVSYDYKSNFIDCSGHYKEFLTETNAFIIALALSCLKNEDMLIQLELEQEQFPDLHLYSINLKPYVEIDGELENFCHVYFNFDENLNITSYTYHLAGPQDFLPFYFKTRVSYTPIYNTRLATQKEDKEIAWFNSSSFSNQKAKVISLQNLAQNEKTTIERIGNDDYQLTQVCKNWGQIFEVGDYFVDYGEKEGKYVITKSEYIYYRDFIVAKHLFTKNFAKLSEFIGINSEYRQFEIPSGNSVYERNMLVKDYAYFTSDHLNIDKIVDCGVSSGETKQNISLKENSLLEYAKVIIGYSHNLPTINNAVIDVDNGVNVDYYNRLSNGTSRLIISSTSEGVGNNLIFHFAFPDNVNAGFMEYASVDEEGEPDGKILLQRVAYTNTINNNAVGKIYALNIKFVSEYATYTTNKYPLTNISGVSDNYTISEMNLQVMKDPSEIIGLTYEICAINKDIDNILIGKDFIQRNNLVYSYDTFTQYRIYGSNTKFDNSTNKIPDNATVLAPLSSANCTITLDSQVENSVFVGFGNSISRNYNYYYIGDKENNVFILSFTNKVLVYGFHIVFRGQRTDIRERY